MNQTAEGVASCGPVLGLAGAQGVEMPITEVVEAVMRDDSGNYYSVVQRPR